MIDWGTAGQWASSAVALFALGVAAWAAHRAADRAEEGARKTEIREMETRLVRVESQLHDMPSSDAVHELALVISQIGGDLKAMVERIDGMGRLVERQEQVTTRLEDYLRSVSRGVG